MQCMALKMLTAFTLRYGACVGVLLRRDAEGGSRGSSPPLRTPGARSADAPAGAGAFFRCGPSFYSWSPYRPVTQDTAGASLVQLFAPIPALSCNSAQAGIECMGRRSSFLRSMAFYFRQSYHLLYACPWRNMFSWVTAAAATEAFTMQWLMRLLGTDAGRHVMHAHLPNRSEDGAPGSGLCEQTSFFLLAVCIRCAQGPRQTLCYRTEALLPLFAARNLCMLHSLLVVGLCEHMRTSLYKSETEGQRALQMCATCKYVGVKNRHTITHTLSCIGRHVRRVTDVCDWGGRSAEGRRRIVAEIVRVLMGEGGPDVESFGSPPAAPSASTPFLQRPGAAPPAKARDH